jgi:hypothetical protein
MAVRPLSRQEFNRFSTEHAGLNGVKQRAVEWFSDDLGFVYGAILYEEAVPDWSIVTLTRDIDGRLRIFDLDVHLGSLDDARRLLVATMGIASASETPTRRHSDVV